MGERATVHLRLAETGELYEVSGYRCTVAGLDMVVHHCFEGRSHFTDEPAFDSSRWTVTEPRTGMSLHSGDSGESREQAVEAATRKVAALGGPEAVEKEIDRCLNYGGMLSITQLALAFKAYVESQCERPLDVVEALETFDLPEGLAEQVGELLGATECPGERGA